MTAENKPIRQVRAAELGLNEPGDVTARVQAALDRWAHEGPVVLDFEPGRVYRLSALTVRSQVLVRGQGAVLRAPPGADSFLLTALGAARLTLEGVVLRGADLLCAADRATIRLEEATLEPVAGQGPAVAFALRGAARLRARNAVLRSLAPDTRGEILDHAALSWRGGVWQLGRCEARDRASVSVDARLDPPAGPAKAWPDCGWVFGRPSGPLWEALRGTPTAFKQILNNPAHADAFRAWEAHNAAQCGRARLRLRNRPDEPGIARVTVNGRFAVDIRETALGVLVCHDQATVAMRGGRLRRHGAYGLSAVAFTDVALVMEGSDDPWHPTTTYVKGNHMMEHSQSWNDLLATVTVRGGCIDFAGDDCLNGLPEWRALQLMEVVHAPSSVFPNAAALDAFAPETLPEHAPIEALAGQAGAVHNEATCPVTPFDFTVCGFRWRGAFRPDRAYEPGDVADGNGRLYVCNRAHTGVAPNAGFDHWQAFAVAFRNEPGYLQVAHRVRRDGRWEWERRQALGPWAGYTRRERGNPIVTYQVHLVLENTRVIRRANTWSFAADAALFVGNSAYNYLLSTLVSNVSDNTNYNRLECRNVELINVGTDATPPIRGLSLGPNRHMPGLTVLDDVRIRGSSIGTPIVFRVDSEPARPDNAVTLRRVTAEYDPTLRVAADYGERRHPRHRYTGPGPAPLPRRAVESDGFVYYEFLDQPPPDWRGIQDYLRRAIDGRTSTEFLKAHPGLVEPENPAS